MHCPLEQTSVKVIFSSFFLHLRYPWDLLDPHFFVLFFFNLHKTGILFISRQDYYMGFYTLAAHWYRAAAERGSAETPETRSFSHQLLQDVVPICSMRAEVWLNKKSRVTVAVASSSPQVEVTGQCDAEQRSKKLYLSSSNSSQVFDPACCASTSYCCVGQLFVFIDILDY